MVDALMAERGERSVEWIWIQEEERRTTSRRRAQI
jgi:hypothetical protein